MTPPIAPGEQIADFEEYTRLYREAWTDPDIRWLLSTVPSVMVFDDHDVDRRLEHFLAVGPRTPARTPWWEARITGAFMSYWVYQHLGNLSGGGAPKTSKIYQQVMAADGDAGPVLRGVRQDGRSRVGCDAVGPLPA